MDDNSFVVSQLKSVVENAILAIAWDRESFEALDAPLAPDYPESLASDLPELLRDSLRVVEDSDPGFAARLNTRVDKMCELRDSMGCAQADLQLCAVQPGWCHIPQISKPGFTFAPFYAEVQKRVALEVRQKMDLRAFKHELQQFEIALQ